MAYALEIKGLQAWYGESHILHGIDFRAAKHQFATRDVDFFLGANYLVTIHDGDSRSIESASAARPCSRRSRPWPSCATAIPSSFPARSRQIPCAWV